MPATMRQRSGQLLAPTRVLGAVLVTLGVCVATGLRREPPSPPVVSNGEPVAAAAALKPGPTAPSVAGDRPAVAKAAVPTLEIKCKVGLASCRKWIALQEVRLLAHSAARTTRQDTTQQDR
jgi:hypothetical protein